MSNQGDYLPFLSVKVKSTFEVARLKGFCVGCTWPVVSGCVAPAWDGLGRANSGMSTDCLVGDGSIDQWSDLRDATPKRFIYMKKNILFLNEGLDSWVVFAR